MAPRPTYCISSAIPYANGAPHIGHAYERIAQDAFARFKRLDGFDVLSLSGMDEHGQKMQQTAAREGLTPQGLADRTAAQFLAMNRL
ncbi:class I tRNA ligase family protein, partial [Salmonella enterica]|nr:class I tRNA ligase family protein [Salmonella enterica]